MRTRKEIKDILTAIKYLRDNATDEQAQNAAILYPEWNENKEYKCGDRVRKNKKVITVSDDHIKQWNKEREERRKECEQRESGIAE